MKIPPSLQSVALTVAISLGTVIARDVMSGAVTVERVESHERKLSEHERRIDASEVDRRLLGETAARVAAVLEHLQHTSDRHERKFDEMAGRR